MRFMRTNISDMWCKQKQMRYEMYLTELATHLLDLRQAVDACDGACAAGKPPWLWKGNSGPLVRTFTALHSTTGIICNLHCRSRRAPVFIVTNLRCEPAPSTKCYQDFGKLVCISSLQYFVCNDHIYCSSILWNKRKMRRITIECHCWLGTISSHVWKHEP